MRQLVALTVVLLVLAGCNAFPGGDATTIDTTADAGGTTVADAPTETTAESATEPGLPPGLSTSGVTDPRTLVEAHAGVLRNASYTVGTNLTASENGTVLAHSNSTVKVAAGGTPLVSRYEVDGERPGALGLLGQQVEAWADETRTLYAMEGPNGTTYRRAAAEDRPPLGTQTGRDHLYLLFVGMNTTVTETETRDGTAHYRVNSTDLAEPEVLAGELRTETVQSASLSALVTEDGLIREYRIEYAGTVENATVQVERTVRFTGLGETTVERPPWYDEAVNATGE